MKKLCYYNAVFATLNLKDFNSAIDMLKKLYIFKKKVNII